jgi:predicted DNA-binding ribbon-helix-helix protein
MPAREVSPAPRSLSDPIEEAALIANDKPGNRLRRNVTLGDRRTSVSLEDQVWEGLTEICRREAIGIDALCTEVDRRRIGSSMSSALRVVLLLYFKGLAEAHANGVSGNGGRASGRAPGHLAAALDRFRADERAADAP